MSLSIQYLPCSVSSGYPKCRIYLWADGRNMPVRDFLMELSKSRAIEFKRVRALLNKMSEAGKITNPENFKDVEGHKPLFEFKADYVRIYCFFDGNNLILVEGDIKKSNKSKDRNRQSIIRAQQRADMYWQEKDSGRLEVIQ